MRKAEFNSFQFSRGDPGSIQDFDSMRRYIQDMEQRLELALTALSQMKLERMHAPPARPRDGMIVLSDGTDWDPGAGRGLYIYDEMAVAYNQLG